MYDLQLYQHYRRIITLYCNKRCSSSCWIHNTNTCTNILIYKSCSNIWYQKLDYFWKKKKKKKERETDKEITHIKKLLQLFRRLKQNTHFKTPYSISTAGKVSHKVRYSESSYRHRSYHFYEFGHWAWLTKYITA